MDPFHGIADPVRRDLLRRLADGPARVVDLAGEFPISRPAISKHLRVLIQAELISVVAKGRERHYSLQPDGLLAVQELLDLLRPRVRFGEAALDGLDLEVRRTVRDHRTSTATGSIEETA